MDDEGTEDCLAWVWWSRCDSILFSFNLFFNLVKMCVYNFY